MRTIYMILATLLALSAFATIVYAIGAATSIDTISKTRDSVAGSASEQTEAGNITVLNLTVTSTTNHWSAFTGNITGNISLSDGTNEVFTWSWSPDGHGGLRDTDGYICASEGNAINWLDLYVGSPSDVNGAWGYAASDPDGADDTFSASTDSPVLAGTTLSNVYMAETGTITNDTFWTFIAADASSPSNKDEFIFCGGINQTGINYKNVRAHYELIVPTVGSSAEEFYFYADLL